MKLGANQSRHFIAIEGLCIMRFFRPLRDPFSALSTPSSATKCSFCSIFRALQDYRHIIPDVCEFSGRLHRFCKTLVSAQFRQMSRAEACFAKHYVRQIVFRFWLQTPVHIYFRSILAHAAVDKFCIVWRRLGFRLACDRISRCLARASTDRSSAGTP